LIRIGGQVCVLGSLVYLGNTQPSICNTYAGLFFFVGALLKDENSGETELL
jgi:hypothetical protein